MENYFEVSKIIDGGLNSNVQQVAAYARQLAIKLKDKGDAQAAEQILKKLISVKNDKTVANSSVGASSRFSRPMPVETDSRFDLGDKSYFEPNEVAVFLPEHQHLEVSQFIKSIHGQDRLREAGLPLNASLLLHGEPGTGKSVLAAYIASQLRLPLITARSDALISSYLGSTSKNIRALLEYARVEPCVLFLDEFDALAKARDDKNEIGELKRVVVSLLQNIDSLGDVVLIAATNHPHLLDPAVWRRFHNKIALGRPTPEVRRLLMSRILSRHNLTDTDLKRLVQGAEGLTGAEIEMTLHNYLRRVVIDEQSFDAMKLLKNLLMMRIDWLETTGKRRNDSIIRLRQSDETFFTHKLLAEVFEMSPTNIRKILKGADHGGTELSD